MSNIIDSIQVSGVTYTLSAETSGGGNPTVELTQAEYDALVSAGTVSADTYYIITDATPIDMSNYYTSAETESAITAAVSGKADTTAVTADISAAVSGKQDTLIAGTNITISGNVISATGGGGGGGTVESAITSGSSNAVASSAIWSAVTYNKEITLDFSGSYSKAINFPNGCTTIKVSLDQWDTCMLSFYDNNDYTLGNYDIQNYDSVSVDNYFSDSTYTISGNVVTITWSTSVATVSKSGQGTVAAVVSGAWVNENTYMKSEVNAIQTTLQNNINQKLDSTAYTPVTVDSVISPDSTNPLQNKVLYDELRIVTGKEPDVVLTFSGDYTSNFPSGCTKIEVAAPSEGDDINFSFYNNNDYPLGQYSIMNYGEIYVNNNFDDSAYEISGSTVIITWPLSKNVVKIRKDMGTPSITAIGADIVLPVKDAFGGLRLVKLTQVEYDALSPDYDSNTLYVIVN